MDSTAFTVALYALTVTTALVVGVVERSRGSAADPRLGLTFWFATGGLLRIMAVGRASDVSTFLTELGLQRAPPGRSRVAGTRASEAMSADRDRA